MNPVLNYALKKNLAEFRSGEFDPDLLSGGQTQPERPAVNCQTDGAVIMPGAHGQANPRTNAFLVKEFQQLAIPLVDAHDAVSAVLDFVQGKKSVFPPLSRIVSVYERDSKLLKF